MVVIHESATEVLDHIGL